MNFTMESIHILRNLVPNTVRRVFQRRTPILAVTAPCFYSSDVPSVPERSRSDPVYLALKSARTTADALKVIGIHANHMSPEHIALSMRTLSNVYKSTNTGQTNADVLNSEEFVSLFRRLKRHLPVLEVNDVLISLKIVTLFKVPHDSQITMQLLHTIKRDINSLSISQLVFLSFLMRQYPRNPIVDALKIALPVVFETQLKTKLDKKNVVHVVDALIYCSKNNIGREATDFVVEALCELDHLDWVTMDPKKARSIALALCALAVEAPAYETAFQEAVAVILRHMEKSEFSETDMVLGAILRNMRNAPYLFHIPLFEAAAELAAKSNWTMSECSIMLRKLNRAYVVNIKLLDLMADKILEDPETFRDGRFSLVKTVIAGLSVANYKTDHWNLLKDLLPACTCLQSIKPREPWIPLCLELASLDIFSDALLSQVFNPWFLEGYLAREYNRLDLVQLLQLYQTVTVLHPSYSGPVPDKKYLEQADAYCGINVTEMPLQGLLEMAFGTQAVLSRCRTKLGHFIDHVIVLQPDGDPVTFSEKRNPDHLVDLDEINIPADCQRVALTLVPSSHYNSLQQIRGVWALSTRVLEALGYTVVNVAADSWYEMPDWEKTPYVLQKIRLRCSHLQLKERSLVE